MVFGKILKLSIHTIFPEKSIASLAVKQTVNVVFIYLLFNNGTARYSFGVKGPSHALLLRKMGLAL